MKKKLLSGISVTILSLTLVLSPAGYLLNNNNVSAKTKTTYVYVVYNGSSVVYHYTKYCRTLSRSKHIYKITLKKAKAEGRRKCKVCY